MEYISRNVCFLFHNVRCSIEVYRFVASYWYFIFHATCFKQFVSLVCAAPEGPIFSFLHSSWHLDINSLLLKSCNFYNITTQARFYLDIMIQLRPNLNLRKSDICDSFQLFFGLSLIGIFGFISILHLVFIFKICPWLKFSGTKYTKYRRTPHVKATQKYKISAPFCCSLNIYNQIT